MEQSLQGVIFENAVRASRNLEKLSPLLSPEGRHTLALLLRQIPDPDSALNGLERYVAARGGDIDSLFSPHSRLHAALALFSHSRFLADTLFRHPQLLDWAMDEEKLYRVLFAEELRTDLGWTQANASDQEFLRTLARFKRMHVLRIALRDLLGLATLAEVTLELSNLADAILRGVLEHVQQQAAQRFGRPLCDSDSGPIECQFCILALGKLGGQELNYSSDIDLMYLYSGEGETSGPIRIANKEFCSELAQRITQLLAAATPEGVCYRVDLRLRPDGSMGEIVLPLRAMVEYYHTRARDWELQMMIKARPAAGAARLGRRMLELIEPLIYRTTTDFSTIEKLAKTRDRIEEKLRNRRSGALDIKLTRGGIRDIEFLAQCLQRLYGGQDPWVRSGGTLFALQRLRDKGYLSSPDHASLSSAYQYFRALEHRLQLENDRQTHAIPADPRELELLASKMHGPSAAFQREKALSDQIDTHLKAVREIYDRVIHAQRPTESFPGTAAKEPDEIETGDAPGRSPSWRAQLRHLERKSPALAAAVDRLPMRFGIRHFEHLLNTVISSPELLREFEQTPRLVECVGDIVEHSPFLAEELMRHPDDIATLKRLWAENGEPDVPAPRGADPRQTGSADPLTLHPEIERELARDAPIGEMSTWLRRFYRGRMLRIQAESIYLRHPIFSTLSKTSRLAEWIIRAAYRIAVRDVSRASGRSLAAGEMQVVALGRLGMREFDLASDADLVFVLLDSAEDRADLWRQVVEQIVDIISSYTSEGMMFTIDTRLRPMGRDGPLVQTESQYKRYFAERAEPWEGITYMKSRTVAGDNLRGTRFLTDLQQVDWKRYGQSGDLAPMLVEMRKRLENEQGRERPIKSGPGGYYDIDFILMYLRLRDAGVFFPLLNTPERIRVVRTLGHLTLEEAARLEHMAVFYRSLDHAIRVVTGRSASKVPTSPSTRRILAALVERWCKTCAVDGRVDRLLDQVRRETREMFWKVFGDAGRERSPS